MPVRCIAFDFDGTLVDSNQIKDQTFGDVVEDAGGDRETMREILSGAHGDRYNIFRRFADRSPLAGHTAESLARDYTRRVEDAIATCPEIAGAAQLLEGCARRGVLLAVISATPAAPLIGVVQRRGWRRLFAHVIGDAASKAAALRDLAARTGVSPEDTLMIGDHDVDRQGAAEFGCRFIGVEGPESDFREAPAYLVRDLIEAARVIEPMLGEAG